MARGGARDGAGRKPKADEITIIENMDAVMVPNEVWQALADKVKEGDSVSIKTWLSYRFGMPKQSIEQSGSMNFTYSAISDKEKRELKDSLEGSL